MIRPVTICTHFLSNTKTLPQGSALKARYRRILKFAAIALAQAWWFELVLPKLGLKAITNRTRIRRFKVLARKFHDLAADLGGLMVKVGQFLSARLDVLPEEITQELSGLQDEVSPESLESILKVIESELGMSPSVAFAEIEAEPIAAASLGQAYKAKLSPGLAADFGSTDVVIKVLRPGIEDVVEVDLAALTKVGGWLSRVKLVSKRTDAPALVEEFSEITLQEINYLKEAENLERFANDFANDPRISTPEVIWERSARRVLTLTDVTAIKISDIDGLIEAGIDPNAVAAELGLGIGIEDVGHFDPVTFDPALVKTVRGAAERLGYSHMDIISGAGHDACWINRVAPTVMVMCPCVDGLSHNEAEEISPEWAAAGTDVLFHAVLETAVVTG
mgnify:CR=1 FL=1